MSQGKLSNLINHECPYLNDDYYLPEVKSFSYLLKEALINFHILSLSNASIYSMKKIARI